MSTFQNSEVLAGKNQVVRPDTELSNDTVCDVCRETLGAHHRDTLECPVWVAEGGDEQTREFVQEWLDDPDCPMPTPSEVAKQLTDPAVPVILGTLAGVAQARAKRRRR